MQDTYAFTIPLEPRTKKNSQQVVVIRGRGYLFPSPHYKKYLAECQRILPAILPKVEGWPLPLKGRYNVCGVYYMKTRHRVDLSNLNNALHDMLVECGIIEDDDCLHIASSDGSHVRYDRENPRTIVTIAPAICKHAWEEDKPCVPMYL